MTHSNPTVNIILIHIIRLLKVLPGQVILLAQKQVQPNSVRTDRVRGIVLLQHPSHLIQLTVVSLLQKTTTVNRQNLEFERVLLNNLLAELVGLVDVVLGVRIDGLDAQNVQIHPFGEQAEGVLRGDSVGGEELQGAVLEHVFGVSGALERSRGLGFARHEVAVLGVSLVEWAFPLHRGGV